MLNHMEAVSQHYGIAPIANSIDYSGVWLKTPQRNLPLPDMSFWYRAPRWDSGLWLPQSCAAAYVNGTNFSSSSGDPVNFPAFAATTGNAVALIVRHGTAGFNITSVDDTAGNSYTQAATRSDTGFQVAEIWYCLNITGHATNVVSIHGGSSLSFVWGALAQYSSVVTTSGLDANVNGYSAVASSITSPSFSTAQADEVIITATNVQTGNPTAWTPPTGYTIRQQQSLPVTPIADKIVSATESGSTVTWTPNASDNLQVFVISLKATGGGATPSIRLKGLLGVGL